MGILRDVALCLGGVMLSMSVAAQPLVFKSGEYRAQLIELYTSQGCSSCPPAERWLNAFKDSPDLWQTYVPVAFHVDYWDKLGWPDPYASSKYSARQRQHRRKGNVNSVYTPGFLVNGSEWRGYFGDQRLPDKSKIDFDLTVTVDEQGKTTVEYEWQDQATVGNTEFRHESLGDLEFHVAVLGAGIETAVRRGENARRTLPQEFVALQHQTKKSANDKVEFTILQYQRPEVQGYAIAAWILDPKSQQVIQATGGWLSEP